MLLPRSRSWPNIYILADVTSVLTTCALAPWLSTVTIGSYLSITLLTTYVHHLQAVIHSSISPSLSSDSILIGQRPAVRTGPSSTSFRRQHLNINFITALPRYSKYLLVTSVACREQRYFRKTRPRISLQSKIHAILRYERSLQEVRGTEASGLAAMAYRTGPNRAASRP